MEGRGQKGEKRKDALCGDHCRGCRYSRWMDLGDEGQMLRGCVYILRTGTRRPCPAGAGCTVYAQGTRRQSGLRFGGERKERQYI